MKARVYSMLRRKGYLRIFRSYKLVICLLVIFIYLIASPFSYNNRTLTFLYEKSNDLERYFHRPQFLSKGGSRFNYSFLKSDYFVEQYRNRHDFKGTVYEVDEIRSYVSYLSKLDALKIKGQSVVHYKRIDGTRPWEQFLENINQNYLYHPDDPHLKDLMNYLKTRPISHVEKKDGRFHYSLEPVLNNTERSLNPGSSHLVLKITFDDEGSAVYKAMRTSKDGEPSKDLFFFKEFERPQAEIAAYHLDKVLGFYRTPPTVSRVLNITRDIEAVAEPDITSTVHRSPAGNKCFYGTCIDYCSIHFPICGSPELFEGSISPFLSHLLINETKSRWSRYFVIPPTIKAKWEMDESYCDSDVKMDKSIKQRELLNYMDLAVFDYLTGNLDRHHVDSILDFSDNTFFIHFDNGRGFGRSKYDCQSCMAPLRQCCMIRLSTLAKLVKLYIGPDSLSHVLRGSLQTDPSYPVLWDPHLDALDRRLGQLIGVVSDCVNVKNKTWTEVIIDDGLN